MSRDQSGEKMRKRGLWNVDLYIRKFVIIILYDQKKKERTMKKKSLYSYFYFANGKSRGGKCGKIVKIERKSEA